MFSAHNDVNVQENDMVFGFRGKGTHTAGVNQINWLDK